MRGHGVNDPETEGLLRCSGLVVLRTVTDERLPSTDRAWHAAAGVDRPTTAIPLDTADLSTAVDAAWLRVARQCGVIGDGGTFLIALSRHEPWTEVRLGPNIQLAENLVGENSRPGQGEFVTMAHDGSVTCGVTTEEYDVWITTDDKHLHSVAVPPLDPKAVDLSGLNFMQVNRLFAPERLRAPYQDGWTLLAFHKSARYLTRLHELDEEASTLAWFPVLSEESPTMLALTGEQARELGTLADLPIEESRLAYYLEYQTAATKSRQSKDRTLPA